MTSLGIIYLLIICLCSLEKYLFTPHARYLHCIICLFTFLVVFFLILMNFNLTFFFVFFFLLVSHLRNHGIVYGNENVFIFYLKSLTVLILTWRYDLCIWFHIHVWCEVEAQRHPFVGRHPVGTALFFEKIILSQLNCLGMLTENQWQMWSLIFWDFTSVPLIYITILMSLPCCLDYCSLVLNFEIEWDF